MSTVKYEVVDSVARITLNRPESLNSMTNELMSDLSAATQKVVEDPSVRVAVLTGAGRGFCSGADLSSVNQEPQQEGAEDDVTAGMDQFFNPAIRAIAELPVPTVARINGVAAGGGFGLALACDIAVMAHSAFFVATFGPRLGIVPDLGLTWHLPHTVGPSRARGIAMLGDRISAEQALELGLVWEVAPDDELDDKVDSLVGNLERSSPRAITRIRSALAAAQNNTLSEQLDLEREHQKVLIPLNMGEGAAAFLEKREPRFSGDREPGQQ